MSKEAIQAFIRAYAGEHYDVLLEEAEEAEPEEDHG